MGNLQTLPGTAIAFTEYEPKQAMAPDYILGQSEGGVIRSLPHRNGSCYLPKGDTHFGFVDRGRGLEVDVKGVQFSIPPGFYFSFPGPALIDVEEDVTGFMVSKPGYEGFVQTGLLEQQPVISTADSPSITCDVRDISDAPEVP